MNTAPQPIAASLPDLWMLDRGIDFLNHGSFGAVPRSVFDAHTELRRRIEAEPIELMYRGAPPLHAATHEAISRAFGMTVGNFGLVTNATEGCNAVLNSLTLNPGDELLTTNHVYHAVRQAMRFVAKRSGASVREIDLATPILSAEQIERQIIDAISPATKLLVIDHITSPTAIVFPVEKIVRSAANRGVDVLIDGAHGPGMLPLDVESIGAAYYAGNLHKWVCAPKGCAFLWVAPALQPSVHPMTISHFWGEGFAKEFGWQGTRDLAAWYAIPSAIELFQRLHWPSVQKFNRDLAIWVQQLLCDAWRVEPLTPLSGELLGSMCTVRLPAPLDQMDQDQCNKFQAMLYREERIEVPIMRWNNFAHVRPCCQLYNTPEQYQRLAETMLKYAR